MTHEAHVNVLCSMLWQRGDRQGNCLRTVSRKQIENVVTRYNEREGVTITTGDVLRADTIRWGMDETMQADRFLLLMKG